MNSFNLENGPKIKPGFKTPDNYFENFSEQMLARIDSNEKPVSSIFQRRKNWFMAAAAVLIIGFAIPFLNKPANNAAIDGESLENYLAYQSTISQYDLINLLDKEDIEALESDLKIDDAVVESALSDNTNLENYLTE
ncbi:MULTISPECIES: hypothetical protein [Flavobacterium]|uniref:hypothetical protein n=1 Tax=Flavobacterium TaxID=237 RepID=UPI000962051C|nr:MULTISPECIES: hypothetical protein [Flavobacterium]MDQ7961789.1 hypothetical protein [Flavobacterium lindanitolerans]OJX54080.1 MAG: hypothetical protein BGO88_10515 [Flavobacterium sp. 38-13]THD33728.1 MAG: hypothetical protein DI588_00930 [Flavobacterium johnsoniae]